MNRPAPLLTLQQAAEEPTGFIYFVRAYKSVKIGYSAKVGNRIRDLQVANPHTLKLMHELPGTLAEEGDLHKLFNADRLRGEWFRHTPEIDFVIFLLKRCGRVCRLKEAALAWENEREQTAGLYDMVLGK